MTAGTDRSTIAGASGPRRTPEEWIGRIRRIESARGCRIQILDARAIVGRDHLVSAIEHAERSFRNGTNATRSPTMELLLYAAGQRQIADALRIVGVRSTTAAFVVVVFGGVPAEDVLADLGLRRDDRVLEPSRPKLERLGFTAVEIATVTSDRAHDLALERVALLDVSK